MSEECDVLIVGCGAVGCAVARQMSLLGKRCVVCEKNEDVLSEASSGNTGHLARYNVERFVDLKVLSVFNALIRIFFFLYFLLTQFEFLRSIFEFHNYLFIS